MTTQRNPTLVTAGWFLLIALPLVSFVVWRRVSSLSGRLRNFQHSMEVQKAEQARHPWICPGIRPVTRNCNAAEAAWTTLARIELPSPLPTSESERQSLRQRFAAPLTELRAATECRSALSVPPRTLSDPSGRANRALELLVSGLSSAQPGECLQQLAEVQLLSRALSVGTEASHLAISVPEGLPALAARCAHQGSDQDRSIAQRRFRALLEGRVPAVRLFREQVFGYGQQLYGSFYARSQNQSAWLHFGELDRGYNAAVVPLAFGYLEPPQEHEEAWALTQSQRLEALLRANSEAQAIRPTQWAARLLRDHASLLLSAVVLEVTTAFPTPTAEAPEFLGTANFVDPYAPQPLHWRMQGANYLVWSVGPNGRDENGSATPPADDLSVTIEPNPPPT